MKTRDIIWFLVGCAAGGLTAYIYTKDKMQKQNDEELDALENYYKELLHPVDDAELRKEFTEESEKLQGVLQNHKEASEGRPVKTAYHKMAKTTPGQYPKDESSIQRKDTFSNPEEYSPDIYVIGEEDFFETENETETLMYYEDDGILAMENDEVIADVVGTIGDGLEKLKTDFNDTVYVRNEQNGTDYEIICIHGSYQENVVGPPLGEE